MRAPKVVFDRFLVRAKLLQVLNKHYKTTGTNLRNGKSQEEKAGEQLTVVLQCLFSGFVTVSQRFRGVFYSFASCFLTVLLRFQWFSCFCSGVVVFFSIVYFR